MPREPIADKPESVSTIIVRQTFILLCQIRSLPSEYDTNCRNSRRGDEEDESASLGVPERGYKEPTKTKYQLL